MILIRIIDFALMIYIWLIIIRAVMSWFNPNYGNPFMQLLVQVTEPVLGPARKIVRSIIPTQNFDISPIVVILLLELVRSLLIRLTIY
jgi:YggT family protein